MLSVAFLYSAGMPALYPIAGTYLCFSYWVDKIFLLTRYKRPPNYNGGLARKMVTLFEAVLFIKLIGFIMIYGNTPIFDNDIFAVMGRIRSKDKVNDLNSHWASLLTGKINFYDLYVYGILFVGLIFFMWTFLFRPLVRTLCCCCKCSVESKRE